VIAWSKLVIINIFFLSKRSTEAEAKGPTIIAGIAIDTQSMAVAMGEDVSWKSLIKIKKLRILIVSWESICEDQMYKKLKFLKSLT